MEPGRVVAVPCVPVFRGGVGVSDGSPVGRVSASAAILWLGLDVHDVGDYRIDGEYRLLEPGMVLTIEPGLYIAPDAKGVAAKWRGIGVRIEDDVLVTRDGNEVPSRAAPKALDDIEALMATGRKAA